MLVGNEEPFELLQPPLQPPAPVLPHVHLTRRGVGAFWWLNLWGGDSFERLRASLMDHPWRLRKDVTYSFDWIATMLRELLHPHPKVPLNTG